MRGHLLIEFAWSFLSWVHAGQGNAYGGRERQTKPVTG